MSKQEWTKEPWFAKDDCIVSDSERGDTTDIVKMLGAVCFEDADGEVHVEKISPSEDDANQMRIVDCVNACKGIDNPSEYISSLRQENERLRGALALFVKYDNDDMLDGAKSMIAYNKAITAARQALTKEG